MAHRIGPTPQVPQASGNPSQDIQAVSRAAYIDSVDMRSRLRDAFPKDGSEPMEAPLPLQVLAFASLPSAALWEGAVVFDTTNNTLVFSDGANWISTALVPVTNAQLADMAQSTIKGRAEGAGTGDPQDLTPTQVVEILDARIEGKTAKWIPAGEMYGGATTLAVVDFGGSGLNLQVRQFDPTVQEFAFFHWAPPPSWNAGTLSAIIYWSHSATVTNFGVRWGVQAAAFGNDDALTNVYTGAEVSDTGGTTDDLYLTAETGAIDPGNTQQKNDMLAFFVTRLPGHADDTLAVDARLHGVQLFWTSDAPNDA